MAGHRIEVDETFDAPRHLIFDLFADHKNFGKIVGVPVRRIRDSDQADPNGVGSVRKIGLGLVGVEQTITSFEPETIIEYTIISLSPLRNHSGRIRFDSPSETTTSVNYTVYFEDVIPFTGALVHSVLDQALKRGMRRVRAMVK